MKVIVDGDACPVLDIIEEVCKEKEVDLLVISDTNHMIDLEYGNHIMVDKKRDSADYVIVNLVGEGDLVVTQDYGLAGMCLGKKTTVLHPSGFEYNDRNIEELFYSRYVSAKLRASSKKKHLHGPSKRTREDDEKFYQLFIDVLEK